MNGRDPDLPILDELGAEFTALVKSTYAAECQTPRRRAALPAPPPRRERGAQARRIGRRAAIVLVLLLAVGGVAFAALRAGGEGSGAASHTSPAQLGRAGDGAWNFSAYRDEGRLCTVFIPRGGELSGNCGAAPRRSQVRTGSAIDNGRRYLFGVAGPAVERVSISAIHFPPGQSGARRTVAAGVRRPVDRAAAHDAGFPAGDGWFVVDLGPAGRGARSKAPAVVTPIDARGRRIGTPYVDCGLGVIGEACKRRIEAAAAGS
jgi:hypothetical protein